MRGSRLSPVSFPCTVLFASVAIFGSAGCKTTPPHQESEYHAQKPAIPEIGGLPVVTLNRQASSNGQKPEFLSATVFPGRGMNLFQITANIPGKGVIPVFASPTIQEAAAKLTGADEDEDGNASFSFGGAFLVPYANRIRGRISDDGKTITTQWRDRSLTLPANFRGKALGAEPHSIHGLILQSQVQDVKVQDTPDGQTVTGLLHAKDFGVGWPSSTDLNFSIALAGDHVDAVITAKNVGNDVEPLGIGWHPYFAIPSGDRKQVRLHVPAEQYAEVNNYDDVFPTGKLIPVKGTKYDFNAPDGKQLDEMFLDDNWSNLTRTDGNVDVELTDPEANYGVKVEGISPEIKTVQVYAPPTRQIVAIEEQLNFADPFGKEWHNMDTGMVTLKPGQSVTWHVRLELFTPQAPAAK